MRKTRTMNRLANMCAFAIHALAALMLVALLAGGSNGASGAGAHRAGSFEHVHLHLEQGEAGLHAQVADCCQPAASKAAGVGGCAFACGVYAQPSPSVILEGKAEADWRLPTPRHLTGAMPDLATPPPKAFG
jgi:hypothetical protein